MGASPALPAPADEAVDAREQPRAERHSHGQAHQRDLVSAASDVIKR
jgi:hypothetical protein